MIIPRNILTGHGVLLVLNIYCDIRVTIVFICFRMVRSTCKVAVRAGYTNL